MNSHELWRHIPEEKLGGVGVMVGIRQDISDVILYTRHV
jgi:hypothetical protein